MIINSRGLREWVGVREKEGNGGGSGAQRQEKSWTGLSRED